MTPAEPEPTPIAETAETAETVDTAVDDANLGRRDRIGRALLPPQQRKTRAEITDALDLGSGDHASKRSAFWIMLTISAVIATAGVIGNSTATVIGAMIIAPLATPIMGIALGVVMGDAVVLRRSRRLVLLGMLLVIGIGVLASIALPETYDLLDNPQITGRTAPTLVDLVAAIATGFAGSFGLARRDVSDVLPGVAIAISLVPPLAVVGVCAGQGAFDLAIGAFVLFVSNVIAMILAGTVLFAIAYRRDAVAGVSGPRRAYVTIGAIVVLVLVPLAVNTLATIAVGVWESRIQNAAQAWLAGVPGADVVQVSFASRQAVVEVRVPADLPPTSTLVDSLQGKVPSGVEVVVNVDRGERVEAGTVP